MKKFIMLAMSFILFFIMTSCRFDNDSFKSVESGDFIYATNYTTFNGKDGEIAIIGLTEEGKQKETLIFPNMIDGHKVVQIGAQFALKSSGPIEITNAKKVYFCNFFVEIDIVKISINYISKDNLEIFITGIPIISPGNIYSLIDKNAINYIDIEFMPYIFNSTKEKYNIRTSNLSYYVDEDTCYFVDYVENKTVSTIPPDPYKDGYTFDGWYKDLEYVEKWNFDEDIVPTYEVELDEDGKEIYKDTKLYAKWI